MSLQTIPTAAIHQLELDVLKNEILQFTLSELSRSFIQKEQAKTSFDEIQNGFTPIKEYLNLIEASKDLPLSAYVDTKSSLDKLRVEGYILDQEEVIEIYRLIKIAQTLQSYFEAEDQENYPLLYHLLKSIDIPDRVNSECERIFDDQFEVKWDASPELARIQHALNATKRRLDKEFQSILKDYSAKGWLTDTAESIRNGRRVLAVQSEFKRKIKGIIHDESATGKVSYIEPDRILDINNDIFDFEQERKREILKLLKHLCSTIRDFHEEILTLQQLIVDLDVIRAKSKFGKTIDAVCPKIQGTPGIHIKNGRHPLLVLKFSKTGDEVIPFTLQFYHNNRMLIVSGPNAGGKTILMKSIGLLQLMVQTCIPVPVEESSTFGVFNKLFVDIGDQQSLEDDLSTYSSHLKNMNQFMQKADAQSLLLIDELGSGTDPRLGGAIAEAILKDLFDKGVHGVITTHYSNLKSFAHKVKGVINGAMSFNKESLEPTYQLLPGKPGSSFAFELAEKSKLPQKVIQYAKKKAGKALVDVDQLLSDIQQQQKKLEEQTESVSKKERQVDIMRLTYEQMKKDLEAQRQRIKMMRKEYDISQGVEVQKSLKELIAKLEKEKDLEQAKELEKRIKQEKEEQAKELNQLEEREWTERQKDVKRKIKVGDFVKIRKTGTSGQIDRIHKGKALILSGPFQIEAKLRDLQLINEPLETKKERSVQVKMESDRKPIDPKLDIRGLPKSEAARLLDEYFDQIILQGLSSVQIVHGKGSGVLKQLVREKAKKYGAFTEIYHPPREAGGEGVSILKT